jgi:hypothetical protein
MIYWCRDCTVAHSVAVIYILSLLCLFFPILKLVVRPKVALEYYFDLFYQFDVICRADNY